ncbi:MAG: class I SAM-dependent methyltransferase [Planctomycetota bacterium]|nr:class I SAM-dependent methyltransferase [Planctomycetota bacterium]
MSSTSTPVSAEHFAYLAERTRPEDAFLAELKEAARAAGIPPIWISPEQASLMQILLKAASARVVVEVGTLAGYSAIAMARALPPRAEGGLVRTIEIDQRHADFAKEWIGRSDVADRIEVHLGAGADVLADFADDSADAAFLDADKSGYPTYLRECLRIVRKGGMILVDNAFAFGQLFEEEPTDREVSAVRAFNDQMARTPEVHGVIVPIGDGLWVSVVETKPEPDK